MKRWLAATLGVLMAVLAVAPAWAGNTFVHGYFRRDGTYVQPHYRSAPDGNVFNNWSTYPNINPYTGQLGTRQPSPYGGSFGSSESGWGSSSGFGGYNSGWGTNLWRR